MHIKSNVFGNIPIEIWEYPVMFMMLFAVFFVAGRIKEKGLLRRPEYKYFLWGLWAKIIGGIAFGSIYMFYYEGLGDTTAYYDGALAFRNLFHEDFSNFTTVYAGPGTLEMKSYFTATTGEPIWFVFHEDKARFVIKLVTPLMIVCGGSYFLTTVLISLLTYGSIWQLYLMFTSYFPRYSGNLAIAILFMPSVIFWGSGIMKDSFTMAATCYFVVTMHKIITSSGSRFFNLVKLSLFAFVIVSIKAYILIILVPGSLVWFFYDRILSIRNQLFRVMVVPVIYLVIFGASYLVLGVLDSQSSEFGIGKVIETASVIQRDLKQDYYEGNSFDIGHFEPTLAGAISKFPVATFAGLYRPLLWESKNIVMFISGIENTIVIAITVLVIVGTKPRILWRLIFNNPVLLYSLIFSLLFAFMIGLTTSNFGALVRFRIPLIPLYMGTIMILFSNMRQVKWRSKTRSTAIGI
ncbi:MAG: hypothetical protein SH856_14730 [Flavobacteriales bacterium]|nr:hypothetical protein [Flavobacteriales bacterium]